MRACGTVTVSKDVDRTAYLFDTLGVCAMNGLLMGLLITGFMAIFRHFSAVMLSGNEEGGKRGDVLVMLLEMRSERCR